MSVYARIVIVLALAAVVVAGYWAIYKRGERAGMATVQQAWHAETARRAARTVEAQAEARATEQALIKHAVDIERKKNATLSTINAAHAAELERLRNRPDVRAADRPGEAASPAATGVGCTGAGLARGDAEFLTRFSADAARLAAELGRCTASYDAAERALRGADGGGAVER